MCNGSITFLRPGHAGGLSADAGGGQKRASHILTSFLHQ